MGRHGDRLSPSLRLVRAEAPGSGVVPVAPNGSPARLEATLGDLYEEYAVYVAAVASRLLGRAGEVDDVVQDVFAAGVRGLRRRDEPREVRAWLAKVTVRRCVRQLRFRRIWALVDLASEPSYDRLADPAAGPEEKQLVVEVYRALDRLPAHERVAWTLRHVEGEALEDIARLCGCSLATAKRRIATAHEKLQRHLKGRES
jgi:RNA polymerase sigma-70 factor (ECF subfamily)